MAFLNKSDFDLTSIFIFFTSKIIFLQVKILELFGYIGHKNEDSAEEMSEILAHIATNTDQSKNTGNSVLSECVRTIMRIEANQSLRILGINILGRFLSNRENNVRYVAL